MIDESKRAKCIYELFCKLNARHAVKKRGTVACCDHDSSFQEEGVNSFYEAILEAGDEDVLKTLILDSLRELTSRQSQSLCDQLRDYCLQQQRIVCGDEVVVV